MLSFRFSNGIFKAERNGQVLGQARTLETLIENAADQEFPPEMKWGAAQVIEALMGPLPEAGNDQIGTHTP